MSGVVSALVPAPVSEYAAIGSVGVLVGAAEALAAGFDNEV